ncbi:MAG: diguanylate cyclase [Xanthobacteraceae bacterium]
MNVGHLATFSERTASIGRLHTLHSAVVLGGIVFAAAMFGIHTRPAGLLAAVWPANAILLGILVVRRDLPVATSYIGASIGYMLADLVSGGSALSTALLTGANLAGVATGHALYRQFPEADRRLQQPHSVLVLFLICIAASAASGMVGGIANPVLFGKGAFTGWTYWFATELANYLTILPVILSAPAISRHDIPSWLSWRTPAKYPLGPFLPAISLGASVAAALAIGGPGSVAFPLPALLWCALSYRIWTTSLLTLVFSFWILLLITDPRMAPAIDIHSQSAVLSIRLGIALVAIGPLMVASVMAARNELVLQLERLASYDHLTKVLNRRAFQQNARDRIAELGSKGRPFAALMLDIDKFKTLNDTHGHAIGDEMLSAFSEVLRSSVRDSDLVGRLGGEEFGVLLSDCSPEEGTIVAERIRSEFERRAVHIAEGCALSATVSIGMSLACQAGDFDALFSAADAALYRAKNDGRNCIRV